MPSTVTTREPTGQKTPSSASAFLTALRRDGYVIIPELLSPTSPLFSTLLSASRALTHAALYGQWPHIRTLPKQFPPWQSSPENGICKCLIFYR